MILRTSLFEYHQKLNAKMIDFAGYKMPVFYKSIKDEYFAVRNKCGIFDISHMAPFFIESDKSHEEVLSFLEMVTCRKVAALKKNQVQYNAFINEDGGIVDDITIFYLEEKKYLVIVNASNKEKAFNFLNSVKNKNNLDINIYLPENFVLLALQGPESHKALKNALKKENINLPEIFYYECDFLQIDEKNFDAIISRTGYTGEDGYEILLPVGLGQKIWEYLINEEVTPSGLGARDLLRLEMYYPLYGNDLKEEWTPFEGGIGWIVDKEKDFLGRQSLEKRKISAKNTVKGFIMKNDGIPRAGYEVYDKNKNLIGKVTSGAFSFLLNKGIGMASIEKLFAKDKTEIFIKIRDEFKPAEVYVKSTHKGSICRRE
ncbi:MAG: glycine cleavage system aminomethyltransferase GcvT [Spirochaetia bacterium]|nr:glycine cleavage system aminomethyltransferase GcvT [Spirochaetia bacterium]